MLAKTLHACPKHAVSQGRPLRHQSADTLLAVTLRKFSAPLSVNLCKTYDLIPSLLLAWQQLHLAKQHAVKGRLQSRRFGRIGQGVHAYRCLHSQDECISVMLEAKLPAGNTLQQLLAA